jgi:demethoxyubiquinone hydroxylase (CLK1/Coq7/Cat5 family)
MTSQEDITLINWEDVLVQNAELRAEVERLRDVAWKHGNRADEAEAEVERLRALVQEHITVHHCLVCGSELAHHKE